MLLSVEYRIPLNTWNTCLGDIYIYIYINDINNNISIYNNLYFIYLIYIYIYIYIYTADMVDKCRLSQVATSSGAAPSSNCPAPAFA